jgi:DNA-binding transcriptional ArsR family regulator
MPKRAINAESQIIEALKTSDWMTWSELQTASKVSKGALSHHLNILLKIGGVITKTDNSSRPPKTLYALHENALNDAFRETILALKNDLINIPSFEQFFSIITSNKFIQIYWKTLNVFLAPYLKARKKKKNEKDYIFITLPKFIKNDKIDNLKEEDLLPLFNPFLLHNLYVITKMEITMLQSFYHPVNNDLEKLFLIFDYLDYDLEEDSILITLPLIMELRFYEEMLQFLTIWENEIAKDSFQFELYSRLCMGIYTMHWLYLHSRARAIKEYSIIKPGKKEKYDKIRDDIIKDPSNFIQFLEKHGIKESTITLF